MSTIPANFGRIIARKEVDSAYTVVPSDDYVAVVDDAVVTLLAASAVPAGWVVVICNASTSANTVTVVRHSGDTIGGAAGNLTLATTAAQVELVSDGVSNWESIRPGT